MSRRQNGMALVIVLWLVVLLGIMAAGHSRNAHTETQLSSRQLQSAQARGQLAHRGAARVENRDLLRRHRSLLGLAGSIGGPAGGQRDVRHPAAAT